jgi:hypothetical protein
LAYAITSPRLLTGKLLRVVRISGPVATWVKRLRDQRAGRHEQQRMAVGRRGGEVAQGRREGVARAVLDIDGGAQALADLLRHEVRHHVGCATGHPADDELDRLTGEILRLDRADRRGDKHRCDERHARLDKAS